MKTYQFNGRTITFANPQVIGETRLLAPRKLRSYDVLVDGKRVTTIRQHEEEHAITSLNRIAISRWRVDVKWSCFLPGGSPVSRDTLKEAAHEIAWRIRFP